MPRILLTGFEPFGKHTSNPSWDGLQLARSEGMLGDAVFLARIPVSYAEAFPALEAAVERHNPDALVSFGLHSGIKGRDSATLYIETTARNFDAADKPDNRGETRRGTEIVPGAAETIQSTLPAQALVAALNEAGCTAAESEDAGPYLCNHLYYRAMHQFGGRFPCGFVHVPPVEGNDGSIKLIDLARAMSVIARVTAGHTRPRQR